MAEAKAKEKEAAEVKEPKEVKETKEANHIGVYVNGTPEAALFTILLSDNTCGMFMMPSARDVFWMGFTKYKVTGDKLLFKIQNENPGTPEEFTKEGFDPISLKNTKSEGPAQFIEATLVPGKEYNQGEAKYIFLTPDVSYWEKLGGFKKLGTARQFEGMDDADFALEIKKLCVEVLSKFGNVFVWA